VLALPESVAERVSLAHAGQNALVVETLSVKTGFSTKVRADSSSTEVLGINPMFAPSLGMSGRPVAAVRHRPGPRVDAFLGRITSWGGRIVDVDADTHDRLAAATQALTHASILAFGTALAALDVDPELLEMIAPPPARASLALLARVSGGQPEVYWDVQAGNPHAAAARRALAVAVTELEDVVDSGSPGQFTEYLNRAGSSVPDLESYRDLCAELFGIVSGPAREGSRS
jgi:prephenate dehydrogenase